MQQANRVVLPIIGPEGIRADQFREASSFMRLRIAFWAHLVQHHPRAYLRRLPRRLSAGESPADDV
jgi:hypothetical protein